MTASQLSPSGSQSEWDVNIDSVPYGSTVAVWTYEYSSSDLDIRARRVNRDGTPLDGSDLTVASTSNRETRPDVAVAPNGDFVVVYEKNDSTDPFSDVDIYFQRMSASGSRVGSAVKVNTYDSGEDQRNPAVAMDANGNFVVVWENEGGGITSGSGDRLQYRRFLANGTARDTSEQFISFGNAPDVAMNDNGDFAVVFYDSTQVINSGGARTDNEVWFEWYSSSGSNTASGKVYNDTSKSQASPVIAMDNLGDFVVAFEHQHSSTDVDIYAQRYFYGGTKNGSHLVVASGTVDEIAPNIDVTEFGFAIGYGREVGDFDYEAWVRRYDDEGNARPAERFGNAGDLVFSGGVAFVEKDLLVVAVELDTLTTNQIWAQVMGKREGRHAGSNVGGFYAASGQIWAGLENTNANGFDNVLVASWAPNANWSNIMSGNFEGPGDNGVIGRTGTGAWWHSDGFTNTFWGAWAVVNWVDIQVGDVNGDGRDDIIGRWANTGQWWIARSTGSGFVNELWAVWSPSVTWVDVQLADLNGDGRQDIVGRTSYGQWWAGVSNGTSFTTSLWASWAPEAAWTNVSFGDVNGDGRDDIAGRTAGGSLWVARSTGSSFVNELWGWFSPSAGWRDVTLADVNGDGRDDFVGRTAGGHFWAGLSTGTQFNNQYFGYFSGITWSDRVVVMWGDFNQDGRREPIFRDPSDGRYFAALSNGSSFNGTEWGDWADEVSWTFLQVF